MRHGDPRQDRRGDDNPLDPEPLRRAAAPVRAEEIGADDVLEAIARSGLVRAADAGVRNERVERPEPGERGIDLILVADVARDRGVGVDPRSRLSRGPVTRTPVGSESAHDRRADSGAGTRDDDVLRVRAGNAPSRVLQERSTADVPVFTTRGLPFTSTSTFAPAPSSSQIRCDETFT